LITAFIVGAVVQAQGFKDIDPPAVDHADIPILYEVTDKSKYGTIKLTA